MRKRIAALLRAIAGRLDPWRAGVGEITSDRISWTDPESGTQWTYWFDQEAEPEHIPNPPGWVN